ncbi:GNAT family N-acetyltransferase [Enterococcus sp. BWT-B8]|uniref:GNAT family N-acetyltransferase n=1 Tax=Enterococcus sp. BWT-B8 TaxID=2885157 RepID=UPI001E4F1924|nr:GNAT family N-acetyltransferase [Enterococcus sp. BWT-B8]MCB5952238.1 GNAT family N-acetyltransferase [Enterococcus sp. BWT-B8]
MTRIIVIEETDNGCMNFHRKESTINWNFGKFCILPKYIGKGLGIQAWELLEQKEQLTCWPLEIPDYSIRNHRFHERYGFHKSGQDR